MSGTLLERDGLRALLEGAGANEMRDGDAADTLYRLIGETSNLRDASSKISSREHIHVWAAWIGKSRPGTEFGVVQDARKFTVMWHLTCILTCRLSRNLH